MLESFLIQLLFKAIVAIFAIFGARMMLKWFDNYMMADSFKKWLDECDDMPKAVYYGLRFLGTGLLVGLVLS